MAVRTPIYYDGTTIAEMTSTQITEWKQYIAYLYSTDPTVTVTVVSASGTLSPTMADTRLQAGSQSTNASAFVAESSTAEPSTVTVNYDKLTGPTYDTSLDANADTNNLAFPAYMDGTDIRAMSLTDYRDTFIYATLDDMISASESASTNGTYTISTSASVSNYTEASGSNTAVFLDTRADTSAYTSGGIPETLDQPTTITSYYLHRRNAVDNSPSRQPLYIDGDNNLREYADGSGVDIEALLSEYIRYVAAGGGSNEYSHQIQYSVGTSGSGSTRGSGMVDTRLNGSGNYQTRQVGNDYRAQEFPNGSPTTIATYNLRITKG